MANRIAGRVYILDDATAFNALSGGNWHVTSFAFWGATTASELILTARDTLDTICRLHVTQSAGIASLYVDTVFDEIKVQTVTAGTGYIYFK